MVDINEKIEYLNQKLDFCNSYLQKVPNIKEFEIIGTCSDELEVEIENGIIKDAKSGQIYQMGIRLFGENGKSCSGKIFPGENKNIIVELDRTIALLKHSSEDPFFKELPHPKSPNHMIQSYYDSEIEKLTIEDVKEFGEILLEPENRPNCHSINASLGVSKSAITFENSNGIKISEKSTDLGGNISLNLMKDDIVGSGFGFEAKSRLIDLNFEKMVDDAYYMASKMLKRTSIKTSDYDLILSPLFVSEMVKGPIIGGIHYESIAQNRSFLSEMLGKDVANSCLSIKNKPDIEYGYSSTNFDDEGVPTREFDILKDGVLQTYLYNSYWANRSGVVSNGCARRGGVAGITSTGPQNIVFEKGDVSSDEMISETKRGIYCEYTGDSPNLTNGYFSGVIMVGYEIIDGEIGKGIEEAVLATPLLDFYRKINQVGNQLKQIGSGYLPHLKLTNIKIAGQ